ncbi:methionyl-tRNA formyltransferase [Leucobacter sp. W1038]|uniref:methionyl-tRNA formyltransferase n=1 Tax=Leucobacter sp. W1038 TaxID=3438281 RepID=UPI003D95DA51
MRIVFAGTPEFAVPSLRALVASGHEIVGVLTREDAPLGRKRVLTPSPVAVAAKELGIPVFRANTLSDEATAWVRALTPDLGVIVAYGGLVREPLLSLPVLGWINLHFSELPRWRGAAPVQRALQAGEQRLGVSVFRLVEALDAGDILTRDSREFPPGTSAGQALTELADFGTRALLEAIDLLQSDEAAGEPQTGEATYAQKLRREDGALDLTLPAAQVLAHWAGMTPEPGAYVSFDGATLKVIELLPVDSEAAPPDAHPASEIAPATVRLVSGVAVLTLPGGTLELARVQPAGKPAMTGADWLRGRGGEAVLS